jgi:hypothetical protein
MKHLRFFGVLGIWLAAPALAQSQSSSEAERAYQGVDFPATHALAEQALESGGEPRQQTARLYVLLGISAAALGNGDEAKQDFVIALAIDPSLKLDKNLSPKLRAPYLEARGYWAAAAAPLSILAKPSADTTRLIVRLVDPASLVAKVELALAPKGVLPRRTFQLEAAKVTQFLVPNGLAERGYEFTVRALDRHDNVLAEQGSDADPELVSAPSAAPSAASNARNAPRDRSYFLPAALGLAGLGTATAGVIFHVKREQAAREWNGPNCENPGQTRIGQCQTVDARRQTNERLAIGFYAASAALLTGGIVALVAGRPLEAPRKRGAFLGCAPDGAGVSCDGRFDF